MSNDPIKPPSPAGLANQLFEAALIQHKGDAREALRQVIRFLIDSLVFSISMSVDNESARKSLLKFVGESIITAPQHPLAAVPPLSAPSTPKDDIGSGDPP
jgi:hypothetical protein